MENASCVSHIILLLGFVFQTFADHAFVDASQIDASDSTPNQTLLHASEKQRQPEATRGCAGRSARFGPRRRAGRRSGAVPPRTPRRETRPKRGVLGGRKARRARVSSVARYLSPSRAPDPLGGSPRVPNRRDVRGARGSTGVESMPLFRENSHGENRARETA